MSGAAPGTTIGPYRLDSLIGSGPVGDVYRAANSTQPGSDVALKFLRPPFSAHQVMRERFLSMQRRITQFDHPHILPSEYIGEQGEFAYVVTPFVPQGSLLTRILRSRLAPRDIAPLFRQICDVLIALHAQGIVHGNLKPSNILLYENRHALIGDMGQVWRINEVNLASISPQAVSYMAPEQAYGTLDIRSDIYSLGCVLYHALTGNVPFMGTSAQDILNRHQRQSAIALMQVQPPLSANALAFDDIFRRSLAKDPRARFASMVDFQKALIEAGQQANEMPSRMIPGIRPNVQGQPAPPYSQPPFPPSPPPQQPNQPIFGGQLPYPQYSQYPQVGPISRPVAPSQQPPMQPPISSPRSQPVTRDQREVADFYTARYTTPPASEQSAEDAFIQELTGQTPSPADAQNAAADEHQEYSAEFSEMHIHTRFETEDDFSREMSAHMPARNNERDSHDWIDTREEDEYSREMSQYYPAERSRSGYDRGARRSQPRNDRNDQDAYEDEERRWYEDQRRKDERNYDDRLERAGVSRPRQGNRRQYSDDSMMMPAGNADERRRPPVAKNPEKTPAKKNRLPSILSIIAVLVLSVNGLLIVTFAPKLCPNHMCDSLHNKIIKYLPIKNNTNSTPASPITPTVPPTLPPTTTPQAMLYNARDIV